MWYKKNESRWIYSYRENVSSRWITENITHSRIVKCVSHKFNQSVWIQVTFATLENPCDFIRTSNWTNVTALSRNISLPVVFFFCGNVYTAWPGKTLGKSTIHSNISLGFFASDYHDILVRVVSWFTVIFIVLFNYKKNIQYVCGELSILHFIMYDVWGDMKNRKKYRPKLCVNHRSEQRS